MKKILYVITLIAFMTVPAAFASATKTKHAENNNAEFQQKAEARFNEYDKKFREWDAKASRQSEKIYREQKIDIEKNRAQAEKDIKRLDARGEKYGKESWGKLKTEASKSIDEFGKALERAGAEIKENTPK